MQAKDDLSITEKDKKAVLSMYAQMVAEPDKFNNSDNCKKLAEEILIEYDKGLVSVDNAFEVLYSLSELPKRIAEKGAELDMANAIKQARKKANQHYKNIEFRDKKKKSKQLSKKKLSKKSKKKNR